MTDATRTPTPIDTIADAWVDTLAELDPDARDLHRPLRVQRPLRRLLARRARPPRRRRRATTLARARGRHPGRRHRRGHQGRPDAARSSSRSSSTRRSGTCATSTSSPRPRRTSASVFDLMPTDTADDWSVIATRLRRAARRASTATSRPCARASPQGIVPARRQVARSSRRSRATPRDHGFFATFAARRRAGGGPAAGIPRPRARRQRQRRARRLRRARRSSSAASSRPSRARRMPSAASSTRCSRAASSAPRSTSTRPTTGASRSSPAWSPSRSRSPTRSRPGASVEEAIAFLEEDPSRKLHGTDALQRWMQETSDRAVAELGKTHFDIPEPIRTLECMIAPTQGGRHLLHRPDRRLLASRPHVVVGARGRRPSSTPGAS